MNKSGKPSLFYSKLAFSNIKKNSRTYFPYILTAIGTIMMFYMMHSISQNDGLNHMSGGDSLKMILSLGNYVIGIFSSIFLFYTNSFLIKRRKKEIGLYNILGMEKRHILKMLSFETLFVALISLAVGLAAGILFSKLMFLVLLKMLQFSVPFDFTVSPSSLITTLILFTAIFFATLLFNLGQIQLAKPIELLKGGQQGEKEPKTKWILAIIGVLTLGAGYFLALWVKSPLEAIGVFFVAVILVIVGTYSLFTAGSIALLKILRKNKKYYYKTKHFTNVSGMIYRMKQNAVGLANICILSTIVLVTLSTTVSLYAGQDDTMHNMFPRQIQVSIQNLIQKDAETFKVYANEKAQQISNSVSNFITYRLADFAVEKKDNKYIAADSYSTIGVCLMNFITVDEYNRLEDKSESLEENEILFYSKSKSDKDLTILGKSFHVKSKVDKINVNSMMDDIVESCVIVVKDETTIQDLINNLPESEKKISGFSDYVGFDIEGDQKDILDTADVYKKAVLSKYTDARIDCREQQRQTFFAVYGGLFFLGIFVGVLFLMATVLIIYYKQISEGFDDKDRFEIMQKVGMSQKEIKKSIQSQILMIFFLPLLAAVVHIAFAFPVITKLLALFGMLNVQLFSLCTVGVILVFALVYTLVFVLTAKSYYRIVRS